MTIPKNLRLAFSIVFFTVLGNRSLGQSAADSTTAAPYPKYDKVSKARRIFLGENNRKLWSVPVKMPVFHISSEKGGLTITNIGGGKQTRSLQLKDAQGHEWVLRTITKYPERALSKVARHTVVEDILKDQISTANPYAALAVPPMEDALGIPHANPELFLVPDDAAFGKYQKLFSNQVCLLEERKPLDGTTTENTEKLQKKLEKDNDIRADQKLLLRARLLDMIIGDWDRHGDQWTWKKTTDSIGALYLPIPKDRDKVFYTTDGVFPWVAAKVVPQLQPFKPDIAQIEMWHQNSIFFDLYFLNQLSRADWQEQISYVQSHLTDELITTSVKLLPPEVYALCGPVTTRITIARRNHIGKIALRYYAFLSRNVDIPATDKKEKLTITELNDGSVNLTINKFKKDSAGRQVYNRTFDPKVTEEIRVYGMGGHDLFSVNGTRPSKIKVRMIGGEDEDTFRIDTLKNKRRLYVYDRSDQPNNLPPRSSARIWTSTDTAVTKINREAFVYDQSLPLISVAYNSEDGLGIMAGYFLKKQGFRDVPYASRQDLQGLYTFSRQSFVFSYKGDFKKAFGYNNNLSVNLLFRGPRNVNSFFGLGNDAVFVNAGDKKFNYYRNRYDYGLADIRMYQDHHNWRISQGLIAQYYTSNAANNINHFFNEYTQQNPDANLYGNKTYAGIVLGASYDTRNNDGYPTSGVYWKNTFTGLQGISGSKRTNGQFLSVFHFYFNPDRDSILVIANRTGAGFFVGNGEFYQMMNLGGPLSLQGFHTSRFIGRSIVFNNLEMRLKVCHFNAYLLAGTLGIIGFNDTGRVWLPGESSDTIHDTYGGGIYIKPFDKFIFSAVIGKSKETALVYLAGGVRF